MSRKEQLRWSAACFFVVLTVVMIAYTLYSNYNLSSREGIDDIPYNELTRASIDGKLDISKSLFQISLLSLAALWGLIIAKKDEAGIILSGNPELVIFICASLLLLFSLVSHVFYMENISSAYSDAGAALKESEKSIMNLFDPKYDYLFHTQTYNLTAGVAMACFTLLSAHKLND